MTKQAHVTLLGVLHIIRGGVVLLLGFGAFSVLAGLDLLTNQEAGLGILSVIGTAAMIIMFILAVPGIIAGIGILQHRQWGRILALIVGFLSLFDIPIGTALGIYTIWVLLDDETQAMFVTGAAHAEGAEVSRG